jgi:methyl-accepting chemotaxis protein
VADNVCNPREDFMRKLNFNSKLLLGSLAIVLVLTIALSVINYRMAKSSLTHLGTEFLKTTASDLSYFVQMQNSIGQEKINTDLSLMENIIAREGNFFLDGSDRIKMTITHQVTNESETVTIPKLKLGNGESVSTVTMNFGLVDETQRIAGGTATIFQVLPEKLLRVSTNVRRLDGERAVGTYIPSNSPVYQAVMRGETYRGKAFVVNDWYITAYKPMRDSQGRIVAVAYVGRKIMTPQLEQYCAAINIGGKGNGFVLNSDGDFLLHPTLKGRNAKEFEFGTLHRTLTSEKDGFVRYPFQGDQRVAYLKYFEPWDWYMAVGMADHEMLLGTDKKVLLTGLGVGGLGMVLAGLLMAVMLRRLLRPLSDLSVATVRIAAGDLNARVDYSGKDAIGATIQSVNTMVGELKNKLGFSEGLLKGLTIPCVVTDEKDRVTYLNDPFLSLMESKASLKEYAGRTMSDLLGKKGGTTQTGQALVDRRAVVGVQSELITRKGSKRFVQIDAGPLYDLDGKLIGAFCLLHDLTELKEQQLCIEAQNSKIAMAAVRATAISEQVSSASEELAAQIDESSKGAGEQRNLATETATAMEEMNASVLEVARNASGAAEMAETARTKAKEGLAVVEQAIEMITRVSDQAKSLTSDMATLGTHAEGIGTIMGVISDIADQTNLLALNAAIEAARAGDAGRGFAVVADEVRKLAEKTMVATNEVGKSIGTIQESAKANIASTKEATRSISESTSLAAASGAALKEIVHMVEQTADQVRNIATASEEQSAASEQISRSTETVNQIATEMADSMDQSSQAVTELARIAYELKGIIEAIKK